MAGSIRKSGFSPSVTARLPNTAKEIVSFLLFGRIFQITNYERITIWSISLLEGQREIVKVVKRVIWQNRDNLNSGLLPGNNMLAVAAFEQIWKEAKGSVLAFCQEKDVYTTHPWDLLNCRAVVFAFDFMRDDCTRKLKKIICGLRFAVLTSVTIEVTQQTIARINQGASVERSLRLVPE